MDSHEIKAWLAERLGRYEQIRVIPSTWTIHTQEKEEVRLEGLDEIH